MGIAVKIKLVAVIVFVLVGLGATAYAMGAFASGGTSAAQYLTATVSRGTVTQAAAATGTVATTASYGLAFGLPARLIAGTSSGPSSSTTWHVKSVVAKVGVAAKKGQVLATADTADLQRQLVDATTSWRAAHVQLQIAETTLSSATTTAAIRQARIGVYNAQSGESQAQQTRTNLLNQIAAATIKAPIDGIVVAVNVAPGLDAPSGDAIVLNAGSLQVTAAVVESDLPNVALGQPAQVTVTAVGQDLSGAVTSVAPVATTSSGSNSVVSYAVTVSITDPSGKVRPGMSADVSITTAQAANVLVVPTTALVGANGSYGVRMLDASGQLVTQPVSVGLVTNTRAEVQSGLSEGETVVTGVVSTTTTTTTGGGGGGLGGAGGLGGGGFGGRGTVGGGGGNRQP